MQKLAIILLSILCLQGIAHADISQAKAAEFFKEGNTAYQKENYTKAISLYRQAAQYAHSASLYYNLGNAYFKSDSLAAAILNFERAKRLNPGNPDIQYNLQLANSLTTDKIKQIPQLKIELWWNNFIQQYGGQTWSALSLIFILLASILGVVFFITLRIGLRKWSFYLALLLLLLSLITLKMSLSSRRALEDQTHAIVFQPKLDVLSAPNNNSTRVFIIHSGTKVKIMAKKDKWLEIKIANGQVGWIPAVAIKRI